MNAFHKNASTVWPMMLVGMILMLTSCERERSWQDELTSELRVFGHRNWIVIADAAYPKQSAAGIKTIYTNAGHMEVLKTVLKKVKDADHVQAVVFMDKELAHVPEEEAAGVDMYKNQVGELLQGTSAEYLPHEEIIARLDASSELFNVLILKTTMTIPYTSVFVQLDCGYWGPEQETRLREKIKN